MSTAGMTSALGLGAASIWGAADFCGGIAARRLRVFWLLTISHAFSLGCLFALAEFLGQPRPGGHILLMGLLSGFAGGAALLTFYHALSLGEMGITAAISGLLTAALPVIFTLLTVGSPSHRQMAGFAVAAAAIWLISSQPGTKPEATAERGSDALLGGQTAGSSTPLSSGRNDNSFHENTARRRMTLAIISGVGFGLFLIFLRQANGGGLLWPLAASRVGSLTLAVGGGLLFSRGRFAAEPSSRPDAAYGSLLKIGVALALLASACDTTGNFLFVAATRIGRLDVAAVLASLYPASTILLAVWLLHERTTLRQSAGMVAAMAAVVLIS